MYNSDPYGRRYVFMVASSFLVLIGCGVPRNDDEPIKRSLVTFCESGDLHALQYGHSIYASTGIHP